MCRISVAVFDVLIRHIFYRIIACYHSSMHIHTHYRYVVKGVMRSLARSLLYELVRLISASVISIAIQGRADHKKMVRRQFAIPLTLRKHIRQIC